VDQSRVTALVPVGKYHPGFLTKAIGSVLSQTCSSWRLLVIGDNDNAEPLAHLLTHELLDPRINIICGERDQLAHKLNVGMKQASTEFVAILLGDDMWSHNAIEVLIHYFDRYPDADLFHSSRIFIDEHDRAISSVYRSRDRISLQDFVVTSPVKHLICWRTSKGLAMGGLDETINYVGPDDYDFPWMMAEAGAVFKSIEECLYLHRDHRECYRLTTHVPRSWQIRETRRIMRKHGVARADIRKRIGEAKRFYLRQCLYRSGLDKWVKQKLGSDPRAGWRSTYR
jgi:glycosyltransferase involved in cell wall biosynthesis